MKTSLRECHGQEKTIGFVRSQEPAALVTCEAYNPSPVATRLQLKLLSHGLDTTSVT